MFRVDSVKLLTARTYLTIICRFLLTIRAVIREMWCNRPRSVSASSLVIPQDTRTHFCYDPTEKEMVAYRKRNPLWTRSRISRNIGKVEAFFRRAFIGNRGYVFAAICLETFFQEGPQISPTVDTRPSPLHTADKVAVRTLSPHYGVNAVGSGKLTPSTRCTRPMQPLPERFPTPTSFRQQ